LAIVDVEKRKEEKNGVTVLPNFV